MFGEIGSRNLQRLQVVQVSFTSESGEVCDSGFRMSDWVEVQEGYYRYLAIDDIGGIVIRMIIADYLGCEVLWSDAGPENEDA
jgi:hypothetical protein